MSVGTGHGATIAFGTSTTFVAEFTSIGGIDVSRVALDTTHLGTTSARSFQPGDLPDYGSCVLSFNFAHKQVVPPITATAAEQITITLPEATSTGNPPTLVGSGFITDFSFPELITDTLMAATATIKWTGVLAFTAETDA